MLLKLTLKRFIKNITRKGTTIISVLYVDNEYECFVLERDFIPEGNYKILSTYSTRFERFLPELLNVSGHEDVRIVPDDKINNKYCLLPGIMYAANSVYGSREAFNNLFEKIEQALKTGTIEIVISSV